MRNVVPCLVLCLASGCAESGDASCTLREQVDDHSIHSCAEAPDLASDEFAEIEDWCASLPGRDYYVDSAFSGELCPRANIVGGCDLGGGRRLWYYPNEEGWPMFDDMESLCLSWGLEDLPPP